MNPEPSWKYWADVQPLLELGSHCVDGFLGILWSMGNLTEMCSHGLTSQPPTYGILPGGSESIFGMWAGEVLT